jgi:glycosyltransferase involved in cell wall biosynthesis
MYIKDCVLSEFGALDEAFGRGYNEENDLVMRANRAGFRAALANHAFVYHIGEASFSISEVPKGVHEEQNAALLTRRYPEYVPKVREYFAGPQYRTDVLATGLMKDYADRRSVVFDFSTVGAYHNGTFEANRQLLARAAESWRDDFQIHVIASEDCARFHRLLDIPNIFIEPVDTTRVFTAAIRIGQPFEWPVVHRMAALAPVNVYGMLDTIAWDCMYLNPSGDLDAMWRFVFEHADGVFYISHFVERQFQTRFRMHPRLEQRVCYLSLDPDDYGRPPKRTAGPGHILVLGNSFAHKRVPETVRALSRAFPDRTIVAVGIDDLSGQNIVCYSSGHLTEAFMDGLYAGASVIVFPSLYEGFGIPVMKALAFQKPLLARDIPVTAELHERLGLTPNIIRYSSTSDLVRVLRERPPAWVDTPLASPQSTCSWSIIAGQLRDFVLRNIERVSLTDIVEPRLQALHDMRAVSAIGPHRPAGTPAGNGDIRGLADAPIEAEKALAAAQARVSEVEASSARTVNELRIALADRESRVKSLEQSLSWSITAPLRAAGRIWLRMFR